MRYEKVHEESHTGFDIALYIMPEDAAPDWVLEVASDEIRADILRKIADGTYLWFAAKVVASRNGIELGDDYLGGCCYSSVAEFIARGGYYTDMVDAAIGQAKEALAKLCGVA
jgi:hypothetical protein